MSKYEPAALLRMFEIAASLRQKMLDEGFSDNGGAIHSAERIVDILGQRLCYPGITHINQLKTHPDAERTIAADMALRAGNRSIVRIEHVAPIRALTRAAAEKLPISGRNGVKVFLENNYRLVLLTSAEMAKLNKQNRSVLDPERLAASNLIVAYGKAPPWNR